MDEPALNPNPNSGWKWLSIVLIVVVVGMIVYRFLGPRPKPVTVSNTPTPAVTVAPPTPVASASTHYPLPAKVRPKAPAPPPSMTLDESDSNFRSALRGVFDSAFLSDYLVPGFLIRHVVATVDGLDREPVQQSSRPLRHVEGQTRVSRGGETVALSEENAARYDAYVSALASVDIQQLASTYINYYPLFQKAYVDLGYPGLYFNDRLVRIIDHLLAAPEVESPAVARKGRVLYEFADPALERRSWGQKIMIRLGPKNERLVKQKLAEFRNAVVDSKPGQQQ
jgi:hypothetical protein